MDPLVLCLKLVDPCECHCDECPLSDVPAAICSCFGGDLDFAGAGKRLYVSLGQFSLIRLERDTQLLIPVYNYCVPEKECTCDAGVCEEDPCELFRHVKFPVSEFFPPDRVSPDGGGSCGCCRD